MRFALVDDKKELRDHVCDAAGRVRSGAAAAL